MDRLSREDRLTLWPDRRWPQDIGALAILDGTRLRRPDGHVRTELVQQTVTSRLHLLPRFRQRLHQPALGLGGPLWVDAGEFDIADHLHVATVPPPGDERQLLDTVARLRRTRLDHARPLWDMWLLSGLSSGHVGLFVRLHHVVADGIAGIAGLGAFMDTTPDAETVPAPAWQPLPVPAARALLVDNLRRRARTLKDIPAALLHPQVPLDHLRSTWAAARELLTEPPGSSTSLDRLIGDDRALAVVRTHLDIVKQIAHTHDAKVNDVLLALTAGGLEAFLHDRGELHSDLLVPVYVPVSLRHDRAGPQGGNLIGQMVVRLPVGPTVSDDRLRRIAAETARRKKLARPPLGTLFSSRLVAALMLRRIARLHINVETADLPGPTAPLYLAGARVLELFPLLNLIGNVTIGVGALSYDGQFNLLITADQTTCPGLDQLVAGIQDELDRLIAATARAA